MAYFTVAGDPRNDTLRRKADREHAAQTDWDALMLKYEKEAVFINDTEIGKRADRKIEALRRDWLYARRMKRFVETGVLDDAG